MLLKVTPCRRLHFVVEKFRFRANLPANLIATPETFKSEFSIKVSTGGPRYMQTFYLRFRVYAIEIKAFQRNLSFNLPKLLVLLNANS